MKKHCLSICLLLLIPLFALSAERPLWLRYANVSPDGEKIAFTYKGDIYTVGAKGGAAQQITSNPAHDTRPVWSPDSKSIVFASNREGSFDLFMVDAVGGAPSRLTTNSIDEHPIAFLNDSTILFSAYNIEADNRYRQFPTGTYLQTYQISTQGGRPTLFSSVMMEDININSEGDKLLYHDRKGVEDRWRKHHQSSVARDVCLYDIADGSFNMLTSFRGENRNPIWTNGDKSFYYLTEESGSFNVYIKDIAGGTPRQITNFKDHPVRFLSKSNNDLLCFTYDGEIYTMTEGSKPAKLNITILSDEIERAESRINFSSNIAEMALSPNDKEVAFVIRGDIFVSSVEYGTTRRITNTAEQERSVSFSPDGKSILYASEREGVWNIYQSTLKSEEDKYFVYAREIEEEQLTNSKLASFQPLYSPDGKKIAYLEDRTTLKVMDVETKKSVVALDGQYKYSYIDGDQWFEWSPDSKWLLTNYIGVGGWNNVDVALVKADGSGEVTNLTESGYSDGNGKFTLGGKAMLWDSDKNGYRSHGSWGAHSDAYIMFFDRGAYDKFMMSKEERALQKEIEEEQKEKEEEEKKDDKNKKSNKKGDDEEKDDTIEPLEFDLENRRHLTKRLTPNSSDMADIFLNKEGTKLYYLTSFEGGYDLWEHDLEERTTKILSKKVGASKIHIDSEEENIFVVSNGRISKVNLSDGESKQVKINAEFDHQPAKEREYIFDHAWRQTKDKFYVEDMHGVDWEMYREAYSKFLPHINNNTDFVELLSEMLGELNVSHTGARYYPEGSSTPTASLGAFYDSNYKGDGLLIKEVVNLGPLSIAESKIKAGSIITKIDHQPIKRGEEYFTLLNGKAGKQVLIAYKVNEGAAEEELWVKPISSGALNGLLYTRWIDKNREEVEKLSNGRLGYIHIRAMNSDSFREVYSDLLGKYRNVEAVVIDTRHNGGGWLHDDIVTLLNGKEYQRFTPRGQYVGSDPHSKWTKPSVVIMSENNYSNAHGVPWLYKELGVGKLVGAPVPGTMTAVWWERQIDPTMIFGIPEVTIEDMRGIHMENEELFPDIEVYNTSESMVEGRDLQLEASVEHLLSIIDE